MKRFLLFLVALIISWTHPASSAVFTSDSSIDVGDTNYDGDEIVVIGCTLTIDGPHSFSDLIVIADGVITHSPITNTSGPGMILIATNNVFIETGSGIVADGMGFESGTGSGAGGSGTNISPFGLGYESGGGAGYGGNGAASLGGAGGGAAYGSLSYATNAGSGGGAGTGPGGAGGGIVQLTVGRLLILDGQISANGAPGLDAASGGGSGGSISITASNISGSGMISANGGAGEESAGGGGAGGRIMFTYSTNEFAGTFTAYGGTGVNAGAAGTIFIPKPQLSEGQVIVDNGGIAGTNTPLSVPPQANITIRGSAVANFVNISDSAILPVSFGNLLIGSNSWLVSSGADLTILQAGSISVQAGSGMNFASTTTRGGTGVGGHGFTNGISYGGGGGHGGVGGAGFLGSGGISSDNIINPTMRGGEGGDGTSLKTGGGGGLALEITVVHSLNLDGLIVADGGQGLVENSGGGAGGSVYLRGPILTGAGSITANGGDAGSALGGGGGGGRISLSLTTNTFTGTVAAHGGLGFVNGSAGTIYKATPTSQSILLLDNADLAGPATPIQPGQGNLMLTNGASAVLLNSLQAYNVYIASNCFLACSNGRTLQAQSLVVETNAAITLDSVTTISSLQSGGSIFQNGMQSGGGGAGVGYGGNSALGAVGGDPIAELQPTSLAGGPGGANGGDGGGNLEIMIQGSALVNGRISANGGNGTGEASGGGGGGTVNLMAGTLAGDGLISANGGAGQLPFGGGGGGGLVSLTIRGTNQFTGALTCYGGDGATIGGAGLVVTGSNQNFMVVTADNGGRNGTNTSIGFVSDGFYDLYMLNGAVGQLANSEINVRNVFIGSNAALTRILVGNGTETANLQLRGNVTVEAGGAFRFDGVGGFPVFGRQPGGAGGSHGGIGGSGAGGLALPALPDSVMSPSRPGASGQYLAQTEGQTGGNGGGSIELACASLLLDGEISANGLSGISEGTGGGAGGSVWLNVNTILGKGSISANGGAGNLPYAGGGGGGRIAIRALTNLFTGTISAIGGPGFNPGGAGTIYTQFGSQTGSLILDNAGTPGGLTQILSSQPSVSIILRGGARAYAAGALAVTGLDVQSNSFLFMTNSPPTQSIQSTGNIIIEAGGGILADGGSGPQNQEGGSTTNLVNGQRTGGGGGNAGNGGMGLGGSQGGLAVNQSIIMPGMPGGAGGGGLPAGSLSAFGGGVLAVTVSGTLTVDGILSANGDAATNEWAGGGGGGSLNITAANITGIGAIKANGGSGNMPNGGGGGGGRIAVAVKTNTFAGTLSAAGGQGYEAGGAGTIYITSLRSPRELIIDNGGTVGAETPLFSVLSGVSNLTLTGGAQVQQRGPIAIQNLLIQSNAVLIDSINFFLINISGNVEIGMTGAFSANGLGWNADIGPGAGTTASNYTSSGGGYGGAGGNSQGGALGGETNGSPEMPTAWGSGGGVLFGHVPGFSQGGGAISMTVAGTLTVNGTITADGADAVFPGSGGGSGGGVLLTVGSLAGNGLIAANGGAGEDGLGGGGGGGRIAVYSPANTFAGQFSVNGGSGFEPGSVGSIFLSTNRTASQIAAMPVPGLTISQPAAPSLVTLSWVGASGATYQVQSSFDLIQWESYGGVIAGTSAQMTVTLTPALDAQQQYFRLIAVQ